MTAGLLFAGILVTSMVVAGLYLMSKAGVEHATRASGESPDRTEDAEARDRAVPRSSILLDAPPR